MCTTSIQIWDKVHVVGVSARTLWRRKHAFRRQDIESFHGFIPFQKPDKIWAIPVKIMNVRKTKMDDCELLARASSVAEIRGRRQCRSAMWSQLGNGGRQQSWNWYKNRTGGATAVSALCFKPWCACSIFDLLENLAPFESKSHVHDIVSQLQALVHLETYSFCHIIDVPYAGPAPVVPEISDQNGRGDWYIHLRTPGVFGTAKHHELKIVRCARSIFDSHEHWGLLNQTAVPSSTFFWYLYSVQGLTFLILYRSAEIVIPVIAEVSAKNGKSRFLLTLWYRLIFSFRATLPRK